MVRARRLALAVLLALAGPGLAACSTSTELRRIQTPRQGVVLRYQLETGQAYEGQLRVGNTRAIEGLQAPLSQTATCDVTMAVLSTTPEGTEIRATFTSVDLDWDLPPSATYSSNELLELAGTRLNGMQVSFTVRPDGRVQALPRPPDDVPPELREVIETLTSGLEAFFVPMPPQAIRRHEPWSTELSHQIAGGLRVELEQTLELEASYEHRTEERVLRRVEVEQKRRRQRAGETRLLTIERDARILMLFAAEGYPAQIDREIREFDPENGMVFRKVRATWTRRRGLAPELIVPPEADAVQVIRDPCNPDYVGPEECTELPPSPVEPSEGEDATDEDATDEGEAAEDETPDEDEADEDEADEDDTDEDEAETSSKTSSKTSKAPKKKAPSRSP